MLKAIVTFLGLLALSWATHAQTPPTPTYSWITLTPQGTTPSTVVNGQCWSQSDGLHCYYSGAAHGPFLVSGGSVALTIGNSTIASGTTGRVLYDNGGLLGELTNTQLTADINAFSSSLSGAAPASGGGSTNFLRADGTWAAPSGTVSPGGSSGNVQYNNAGAFGGLTDTQLTTHINAFTSSLSGAAPSSGGGTSNFLRADGTWAVPPGTTTGTVTTSGTPANGNLTKFTGTSSISNGDLAGDVTTSGTLTTTVGKVNGVTFGASPSTNTVPVVTGSNTVTYEAVPLGAVAAQAADTVVANVTAGSAAPTAASLPSCTDSGGNHLNYTSGTGFSCGTSSGGGSAPLSSITAGTGANTVASGDNAQVWNWTLTTAAKSAFTFGETAAATNGAGSQFLVDIDTLSASTAAPLRVKVQGTAALTIGNQGALTYAVPTQPTSNTAGPAISLTAGTGNGSGAGGAVSITAGNPGATAGGVGGAVTILAGGPPSASGTGGALSATGGSVNAGGGSVGGAATFQGGNAGSSGGAGGNALFAGGDAAANFQSGGTATFRGGDTVGSNSGGGSITLRSGNSSSAAGSSGNVTISTGSSGGVSGNISLSTASAASNNAPGTISITTGGNTASSGLAWNVNGGAFSVTTGAGGWQNSNGGDLTFTGGAPSGTGHRGQTHFVGQVNGSVTTLSISTATFTPDGSNNHYYMQLVHASCPCTLANPSQTPVAGTTGVIEVQQSSTGSDTIGTWGSQYMAPGGTSSITLSTGANAIDVLSYFVVDSTHILLVPSLNFTH